MELYNKPANLFVAGFIGSPKMNFLDGGTPRAARRRDDRLPSGASSASAPAGAWPGKVSHAEHLGSDTMVYVDVPDAGTLTVRMHGDASHQIGEIVKLAPVDAKIHRFDASGAAILNR